MEDVFIVYAIRSRKDNRIYVGFSSDVSRRLLEHNSGKTRSTKGFRPWDLVYQESVSGRLNAREREKYLKSGTGKEFLKTLLGPNG
ncbi:MAG: GIY-YIG nuclease family protein [Pedobacter sp.]|nr:GIY-YIG nuclease family protein [Pedobacter sp.]MDQ8052618.1 GIY-YIG nuclease family protein [Pedobacter sp.]